MNRSARRRVGRRGLTILATFALIAVAAVLMGGRLIYAVAPNTVQPTQPADTPSAAGPASPDPLQMKPSNPSSLKIPSADVKGSLLTLGKQKDKNLVELPSPATKAGWYDQSATPGEPGVATIVGYIRKSKAEAGVFSKLSSLKTKDKIYVDRKDGSTAVFSVDKIKSYAEGEMPESEVYGSTERSELRLITCGGVLEKGDAPSNVVVFAHLVDRRM